MFEEIRDNFNASPYYQLLGMKIVKIDKGFARLKVGFNQKLNHIYGGIHGGVLASAGDAAVGAALVTLIGRQDGVATIELKINYLAPVKFKDVIAEGRIVWKGRTIAVGGIKIFAQSKAPPISVGLATYMILARKKSG